MRKFVLICLITLLTISCKTTSRSTSKARLFSNEVGDIEECNVCGPLIDANANCKKGFECEILNRFEVPVCMKREFGNVGERGNCGGGVMGPICKEGLYCKKEDSANPNAPGTCERNSDDSGNVSACGSCDKTLDLICMRGLYCKTKGDNTLGVCVHQSF